jgi:opacity protein-like surface antigen
MNLEQRLLRQVAMAAMALAIAAPAAAQVHLQLNGGATRSARTDSFVSGELGARMKCLEIDVEAGRMNDVLPKGIVSELDRLQRARGLAVQLRPSLPASYLLGTIKLISPAGGVKPFVSAGYGIARVEPRVDVDIPALPIADVFGIAVAKKENDPMLTFGAGLRISAAPDERVHVDVGYRYVRIFSDFRFDTDLDNDRVLTNAHTVYAGVGVRF